MWSNHINRRLNSSEGNKSINPLVRTMHDKNNEMDPPSRESELEYLSDMIPQMRLIALGLQEKTLAYLLELAMVEAKI